MHKKSAFSTPATRFFALFSIDQSPIFTENPIVLLLSLQARRLRAAVIASPSFGRSNLKTVYRALMYASIN
jgi:hypothetical protein